MTKIRFFDTSALQHRYVNGPESLKVRRLTGLSDECFIAESTMLEMVSALAKRCRGAGHDAHVFDRWELKFHDDVGNGRLKVRSVSQRIILRARHLIRFAGVLRKRNLGSADALIASACLELALERHAVVTFYTSDWALYSIIRDIDAFTSALRIVFVGPPRHGIPLISGRRR